MISCHNPIRREIARVALERLISDGRIHPGRIEEVVRKAEQEVEESITRGRPARDHRGRRPRHPSRAGQAARDAEVPLQLRAERPDAFDRGGVHLRRDGGRARASTKSRPAAPRLLHDIGKALTHEVEGSHALIGGEIARKYGESAKIVNAIAAHHEEVKAETILAPLVDAADALVGRAARARGAKCSRATSSASRTWRPIAKSFKGVEKCFAVQAGREMRVIVEPTPGLRRGRDDAGARGRAEDRNRHDLSRTDSGHGHPRNARDRARALRLTAGERRPWRGAARGLSSAPRCRRRAKSSKPQSRWKSGAWRSMCASPRSSPRDRACTSSGSGWRVTKPATSARWTW